MNLVQLRQLAKSLPDSADEITIKAINDTKFSCTIANEDWPAFARKWPVTSHPSTHPRKRPGDGRMRVQADLIEPR